MIVADPIAGDSKVQTIALTAARDGWDVILIGRSTTKQFERTWYGPVKVIRIPVGTSVAAREAQRRRRTVRSRLTQTGLRNAEDLRRSTAAHQARQRQRDERYAGLHLAPRIEVRGWSRLSRDVHRLRIRLYEWEAGRQIDANNAVTGDWRRDCPSLLDLDLAYGPVIERLAPDVIHANDVTMLPVAATSATRLRSRGKKVAWLYDAHEYVSGADRPDPRRMTGYPAVEKEFIRKADAVVTVSPEIADMLHHDYRLPVRPLVVRNTPIRATVGTSAVSVRVAAGLADDVPLLVYSGDVRAESGLDIAIQALPSLPEFHLALVSGPENAQLKEVRRLACEVEVVARLHVVPHVSPHHVPDYLASADLGIICSKPTINSEKSLPAKFAEYLHGKLPVVVNDLETLGWFVAKYRVGEVFAGDPTSFVAAVRRAWGSREQLRANISEEILDDLSWEHQSVGLLQLYRSLAGKDIGPPLHDFTWEAYERPGATGGTRALTTPNWRPLTETRVRLGLGSANYAGQLAAFARAVTEARGDVSAEVFCYGVPATLAYPADVKVENRLLRQTAVQLEQAARILPRYTHLLADAYRPIFGPLNGPDISADLPALRQAGIKVALLGHGTEIRHPLRHLERESDSPYRQLPAAEIERLVAVCERNLQTAAEGDLPLFVTTPDLIEYLPDAVWIPLVVDVTSWATDKPLLERDRPIVLHAPSARWTKGTERFIEDMRELHNQGLIKLKLAEGVPWRKMRRLVQDADIVIDQVAIGSYGTFACEAMAAGKPVIAHLSESVVKVVGEVPPIIDVTGSEVAEAVARLVADRTEGIRIGREAAAYVREWHDGTKSAHALNAFLDS